MRNKRKKIKINKLDVLSMRIKSLDCFKEILLSSDNSNKSVKYFKLLETNYIFKCELYKSKLNFSWIYTDIKKKHLGISSYILPVTFEEVFSSLLIPSNIRIKLIFNMDIFNV